MLSKNTRSRAKNINGKTWYTCLFCQAFRDCCGAGRVPLVHWLRQYPAGQCLANLRRFWAGCGEGESSFAPRGQRILSPFKPRISLRWSKCISTFVRGFIEITYFPVFANSRATCRASSCFVLFPAQQPTDFVICVAEENPKIGLSIPSDKTEHSVNPSRS